MYTVDELDERISREKVRIARLKQQLGESVHELARLQEQRQQRASEPCLTTPPKSPIKYRELRPDPPPNMPITDRNVAKRLSPRKVAVISQDAI